MKLYFITDFLNKTIAKQLRRPGGILAGKVGNGMNKTNSFLYDFTIEAMQLKDNESILEIGFGNGKFFDKLFSAAGHLDISGLDFSSQMVKAAARNNRDTIDAGKLHLQFGSSDNIPFPANRFDTIFCINVIYFWEQPADHLKEIYRVLKPGGKLYTTIRTKDSLAQMPFSAYGFNMYTPDEWVARLEDNQFHFMRTETTKNEPGVVINRQVHEAASICIVAEKKY